MPTRGDQAGRILCLDQGIHGSGERASHPGYGTRRHPSGDRTPQAEEPRSETTGCRPFPGDPPLPINGHSSFRWGLGRMSAQERSNVITRVEETRWGKRRLLAQLQVPRSTYYRWRARELQGKQDSPTASTPIPWTGLVHQRRPQYRRRPGSLRSGATGNWPLE